MNVALVIPTLNEAERLPRLLESVARQTIPFDQTVVCDGGSTDETLAIAARFRASALVCAPGRGGQIAAGVDSTNTAIVLVLHADSRCQPQTVETIVGHFRRHPESPGGCLGHRFDKSGWLLRLVEWADRRRARRGLSYGDQGQFFQRAALEHVGGFPRLPLMEDLELCRRLQRLGPLAYLDLPVVCSPRGFERFGVLKTSYRNARLRRDYLRHGVAPDQLYNRYYAQPIPATRSAIR